MQPRDRWRFPFYADYITAINGEAVTQRVKVIERFGGSFRVKSSKPLRVAELENPIPRGMSELIPVESVHDSRRTP